MGFYKEINEHGPSPYIANVGQYAMANSFYRTVFWTGCHMQMTLMSIPICSDIGVEVHEDTDQIIRIEQGRAQLILGECEDQMNYQRELRIGDTVFVPAGIWHNVINVGRIQLKLSSIYAPPHHPAGLVMLVKEEY